jgi:hypothetical protein
VLRRQVVLSLACGLAAALLFSGSSPERADCGVGHRTRYDLRHIASVSSSRIKILQRVSTRGTGGCQMAAPHPDDQRAPLGQRLLDHPFLLLAAGLIVMFGFYTLWGLYEILTLPTAALP